MLTVASTDVWAAALRPLADMIRSPLVWTLLPNDADDDNDGILDKDDGKLDPITGIGEFSRDPARPFSNQVWGSILVSVAFLGVIGYRIAGWRGRKISISMSKRIRIQ